MGMQTRELMDLIEDDPCPLCGCTEWVVEGDNNENWLLCTGCQGFRRMYEYEEYTIDGNT